MKVTKVTEPFEHLIVEDVYTLEEEARIWRELDFLTDKMKENLHAASAAKDVNGEYVKHGKGVFLDTVYADKSFSDILALNQRSYVSEIVTPFGEMHPAYKGVEQCDYHSTLINLYTDGDYYGSHKDRTMYSFVTFFFRDPRAFMGGDFVFTDYNHTVPKKSNMMVVFPGVIAHEVTPVTMQTDKAGYGRYSMAQFLRMRV